VAGPPKLIRAALLAIGGTLALAAAGGCGGDDEPASAASLAPPDAPFFVEGTIRPDGDRAEAIVELSSKVAGVDDLDREIVELIDEGLASEGGEQTFAEDVEPWLGEEGAIFVRSLERSAFVGGMADAAYIAEVTDVEAAQAFVDAIPDEVANAPFDERSYDEVDYLGYDGNAIGLVGDFLVAGTEASFKAAVDATTGEALADTDEFADTVGDLDDSAIAEMWLDLGTLLDAAAESSDADGAEIDAVRAALGPLLEEPVAMALEATPDTVTLDISAAAGATLLGDTELLEGLPGRAWVAVATGDAGETVQRAFSSIGSLGAELGDPRLDPEAIGDALRARTGLDLEADILPWVGDAAFYFAGTDEASVETGAVVETSDEEASVQTVAAARAAVESAAGREAGPPRLEDADDGFSLVAPTGQGFEVAVRDDVVVAALGGSSPGADTLEPDETLGDSERFSNAVDALGGDHEAAAFLALQDALVVAERGDTDGSPDYDAIRPYTQALDYLMLGTATDDDRNLWRVVLGVAE
jgi:hypothetical protein